MYMSLRYQKIVDIFKGQSSLQKSPWWHVASLRVFKSMWLLGTVPAVTNSRVTSSRLTDGKGGCNKITLAWLLDVSLPVSRSIDGASSPSKSTPPSLRLLD